MFSKNLIQYFDRLEKIKSIDDWIVTDTEPIEGKLKSEDIEILKTERKTLAFCLKDGDLQKSIGETDKKGQVTEYPNTKNFSKDDFDHIKKRSKSAENPFLKSRYSHLCWKINKHKSYAEDAIKAYIKSVETILNREEGDFNYEVHLYAQAIVYISKKIRNINTNSKQAIDKLLHDANVPFHKKYEVGEFCMKHSFFDKQELIGLLEYFDSQNNDKLDYHDTIELLNLLILIARKTNKPTKQYYKLLAENERYLLDQHREENDHIRISTFLKIAQLYKEAGLAQEYDNAMQEYTALKPHIHLDAVKFELDKDLNEELNKYQNKLRDNILEADSDNILAWFSTNISFLWDDEKLEKAPSLFSDNPFLKHCNKTYLDINVNLSNPSEEEVLESDKFRHYSSFLYLNFIVLFIKTFSLGVLAGKLNYYKVFKYLRKKTWYGQRFPKKLAETHIDEDTSWLSLIAPGLFVLFNHFEKNVVENKVSPNYILAIDSLTFKFEGALRDFIRISGGSTTYQNKDSNFQEQSLEQLLNHQVIKDKFSIEDRLLFEYVFTQKGWNLRNNVAHSFFPYSNYSYDIAIIIFLCILRLGQYKMT